MNKNLEIKFTGYSRINNFMLDKFTDFANKLVNRLVQDYEDSKLDDGVQYYYIEDVAFIIDVNLELEEITVVDILE